MSRDSLRAGEGRQECPACGGRSGRGQEFAGSSGDWEERPAGIGAGEEIRVIQGVNRTIDFGGGQVYTLDEYGFLDPPEQWTEEFADGMAGRLGIGGGLTLEHWNLIYYLRRKFVEEKTVPVVVSACADNNIRLSRLRFLFPTGYHRGACKIAGINYRFMYECNIWLTYESYSDILSEYRLTPAGFLEDFEQWNERFAHILASQWKLPGGVTEKHLEIIRFLRDFYRNQMNIPTVYETCRANGIDLEGLRELFPNGYRRGACRMAGLPFFS